ncbi:MAG: TlyA family RNA methyltransferase [Clostridiales bacterium]|nr:TlyA family RNA methyltransferase [Clostridiales bacterium]
MKQRLDVLLVNRNLAKSLEKAKAIIMTGDVFVNGQREDKAGSSFSEDVQIDVKSNPLKYVSRGGLKLEKAMEKYGFALESKVCMDVGSSTGGFTDCMLQNGAVKVYAVDVGTNQLAWKLRQDERVISMEKTNIRYLTPDQIDDKIDFASIDVSFISLTKVLLPVRDLLDIKGEVVSLIKPQFEASREKVGKKGVVRDPKVHVEVIQTVTNYANSIGFDTIDIDYSPIKGPEGNIEYLLYMRKNVVLTEMDEISQGKAIENIVIQSIVDKAHNDLADINKNN